MSAIVLYLDLFRVASHFEIWFTPLHEPCEKQFIELICLSESKQYEVNEHNDRKSHAQICVAPHQLTKTGLDTLHTWIHTNILITTYSTELPIPYDKSDNMWFRWTSLCFEPYYCFKYFSIFYFNVNIEVNK